MAKEQEMNEMSNIHVHYTYSVESLYRRFSVLVIGKTKFCIHAVTGLIIHAQKCMFTVFVNLQYYHNMCICMCMFQSSKHSTTHYSCLPYNSIHVCIQGFTRLYFIPVDVDSQISLCHL